MLVVVAAVVVGRNGKKRLNLPTWGLNDDRAIWLPLGKMALSTCYHWKDLELLLGNLIQRCCGYDRL